MRFIVFGSIWDRFITAQNLVQNGAGLEQLMQIEPLTHVRIFHDEHTRSAPIEPLTHVFVRFIVFRRIWDHFIAA